MEVFILKEIINQSSIGYSYQKVIYDNQGQIVDVEILDVNDLFKNFLGINENDFKFLDIMPKVFNPKGDWLDIISQINKDKESKSFDFYSFKVNCNCNITVKWIKDDYFLVLIKPISVFDDSLHSLKKLYQIISNNVAGYLYILDMNYNLYYISQPLLDILECTENELKSFWDKFLTAESKNKVLKIVLEEVQYQKTNHDANHRNRTFELELLNKNKEPIYTEHMMKLLVDKKNKPFAIIGIARDISLQKQHELELKKNQEQLQLILNSTVEGIYGLDMEGRCTFTNASCLRLLGYDNESELIGKKMQELIHYKTLDGKPISKEKSLIQNVFKKQEFTYSSNVVFWRKDKTHFIAEVFAHPQKVDGKMVGVVITFYDVTITKKVEEKLRETERSKSVLLSNLPGIAFRCAYDKDWTMYFVSDGCLDLTGYKPEDLINNSKITYNSLIDPKYRQRLWDKWVMIINEKKQFREEYPIITKCGERKWVLEQGQAIYNEHGEVEAIEGLVVDITEQKAKEEEVRYLSYHDGLTGLYNRIYFEMEKKRLDQPKYLPLTVLMGDINGLKLTNDAFGHDEGDRLIIETARLLRECLEEDVILARTGGDEFSILMPNTTSGKAYAIMKKIMNAQDVFNESRTDLKARINISLGYATKEVMEQKMSKILKQAEDYMYKRKLLERNSLHSSIIASIKTTMYANSQETEEHAERLNKLSHLIGKKVNLTPEQLDELSLLATLHDIGKVGVDKEILNKPGPLTDEEWEEMRKHPEIGYRIAMASPDLVPIAKYILYHHEKWDGTGYPEGLIGEDIPLLSRIIAVADAYDAMTNDRPYRKAISKEEALKELIRNAGTQFDPYIVSVFVSLKDKF
ncbi:TPA: diguanylate cyclase [bacterium]|nr:diguanylate cyclase [bacterium]